MADDADLVRRAAAGQVWAKAELFKRHAPAVTRLLARLLSSSVEAEDAVQDTFVTAFSELGQLRAVGSFGGWLRQIAVHQAHRRFRKRKLLRALGLNASAEDASLAELAAPGAAPDVRAELSLLDEVLRGLPAAARMAWMLRHVEGYELNDVAILCRCSLATAKRRIAAAHERISAHVSIDADDARRGEEEADG